MVHLYIGAFSCLKIQKVSAGLVQLLLSSMLARLSWAMLLHQPVITGSEDLVTIGFPTKMPIKITFMEILQYLVSFIL
jgi:hypothetical protein